jgi:hypothetical protein
VPGETQDLVQAGALRPVLLLPNRCGAYLGLAGERAVNRAALRNVGQAGHLVSSQITSKVDLAIDDVHFVILIANTIFAVAGMDVLRAQPDLYAAKGQPLWAAYIWQANTLQAARAPDRRWYGFGPSDMAPANGLVCRPLVAACRHLHLNVAQAVGNDVNSGPSVT